MSAVTFRELRLPLGVAASIIGLTLMVPWLGLADPVAMRMELRFAPPSPDHLLGADSYGRDMLSRVLWGARISLAVAFFAAGLAALAGTILGLIGGFFRGITELLTVRASEVILCLPPLLLALLVVTLVGPGAGTLILSLTILFTPAYARVAYAETLAVRGLDYVTAQEALGTHPWLILARTILPNVLAPLIVQFSLTVASAIVLESGLSFLGLGVVPPTPSWGLMIRDARSTMEQAPMLLVRPCLALAGTVLALNALCDRLRDVLDPRGRSISPLAGRPRDLQSRFPAVSTGSEGASLLSVKGLSLTPTGSPGAQPLVRDVSFDVRPGEVLALVGESGCGKTLTGLAILGLLPPGIQVSAGSVNFASREGLSVDLLGLAETERRKLRGDQISMVFQDPSASLNPVHRVGAQIAEAILAHRPQTAADARRRSIELLTSVGLPDAARYARSYPHELSGGQRQRAMIATAIANKPRLLLADEPTTALDVTIQAQILELLDALKRGAGGMGMIFVTHNLAVVSQIADRVCIMYAGEIVEQGPAGEVFARPAHPYTAALLASVPEATSERLSAIPGAVPRPGAMPRGCRFAPRCSLATAACNQESLALQQIANHRSTRCIRWQETQ